MLVRTGLLERTTISSGESTLAKNREFPTLVETKAKDVVFVLWVEYARKKRALIDQNRHQIAVAMHPSPL